jgi:hypothetical protein
LNSRRDLPRQRLVACAGAAIVATGMLGLASNATAATAADPHCAATSGAVTCTYSYTGAEDVFTVPTGVSSVRVTATGASGGGSTGYAGGRGAYVASMVSVQPGEHLFINVGGPGDNPNSYNGGGDWLGGSNDGSVYPNGFGGGATDLRTTSAAVANSLYSRLVIAGGGGGAGLTAAGGDAGSAASGDAGSAGSGDKAGGGGTSTSGGAAGGPNARPGQFGAGGRGFDAGASGGGGYFGGGGGGNTYLYDSYPGGSGGGGGSSFGPSGATVTLAALGRAPTATITYFGPNVGQVRTGGTGGLCVSWTGADRPARVYSCSDLSKTDDTTERLASHPVTSGIITITNVQSGLCLDTLGGATTNGASVTFHSCNGARSQQWRRPAGATNLVQVISGRALDTANGSTANGTLAVIGNVAGSSTQTWAVPVAS